MITAIFTPDEIIALRNALSEETVRMRKHIKDKQPATIGTKKYLVTLENLLVWAKAKA